MARLVVPNRKYQRVLLKSCVKRRSTLHPISERVKAPPTLGGTVGNKRAATPNTHWSGKPPPRLIAQGCLTPLKLMGAGTGQQSSAQVAGCEIAKQKQPDSEHRAVDHRRINRGGREDVGITNPYHFATAFLFWAKDLTAEGLELKRVATFARVERTL